MKTWIELEEAKQLIKQEIEFKDKTMVVNIDEALNYIVAKDIYAPMCQPPFNKSALDGYTFKYEDTINASLANPAKFKVIDTVYAGEYSNQVVRHGQAVNIMTGGRIPEGCNCVIRFEDTNDQDDLEVYQELKPWANICLAGEDIKEGSLLFKKGEKLDYIKIAILSGMGINQVIVYQPLTIGLLVTGSEVVPPGSKRGIGQIYDQNMALLKARLQSLGNFNIISRYVLDDIDQCSKELTALSQRCDLIFTTGGVSVGKKDILHDTLALIKAKKVFWKIRLKPGTPTIFSLYHQVPILSLSGNPFASSVVFELLGRYLLALMQPDQSLFLNQTIALLQNDFNKKSKQRRFIRAIYHEGKVTIPSGMHSSNELGSLIGCNALIDVASNSDVLKPGSEVTVWLL